MYSRERYAALVDAIESLDDGVCVAERQGRVLYQNEAFRRLLSAAPDQRALTDAIRDARRAALARTDDPGRKRRSPHSASFTVMVTGASRRHAVRAVVVHRREGDNIVLWIRPLTPVRMHQDELRHRHGLTPRESRVTTLIESGARTREIADALGISVHTARRHTESVLRKLGLHSRNEVRQRLRAAE